MSTEVRQCEVAVKDQLVTRITTKKAEREHHNIQPDLPLRGITACSQARRRWKERNVA
jgi:hypothetical protein